MNASQAFQELNEAIQKNIVLTNNIQNKTIQLDLGKQTILQNIDDLSAISQESAASNQEITATIQDIAESVVQINNTIQQVNAIANNLSDLIQYFSV